MQQQLGLVTFLVREYDESIDFFTQSLSFNLVEDTAMGGGKRWVRVTPGSTGSGLLLARAATPEQVAQVGNQAGGRVFLFLQTDDFARDHAAMQAHGIKFLESPRRESYGTVAVFADLYGNKWDLLQLGRFPEPHALK